MATVNLMNGFRDLYLDLSELSQNTDDLLESRLHDVERLRVELESRQAELRALLEKSPKNDESRESLSSGKIVVDDIEYSINEEFKQETIQLADALNLDELQAARLFMLAESDAESLGRSRLEACIIQFHSRRKDLLASLRLLLKLSVETESNEELWVYLREFVGRVIKEDDADGVKRAAFPRRCLSAMASIKRWTQELADKIQGASIVGAQQLPGYAEMLDYQQTSLMMQHEDLGAILCYLVKGRYTRLEDFRSLLRKMRTIDKYDHLSAHFIPTWIASMSRFGSPESDISFDEARSLHKQIVSTADADAWSLRYLQAATTIWWLSEYSGRFVEGQEQAVAPDVNLETETGAQSKLFYDALKDGAFDFILSLSVDVKPIEWHDAVKYSLRQWLQKKAPSLLPNSTPFSDHFQILLMEQLESFIDAIITNMPGNLRRLRVNEDQQRLRLLDVDPLQQELDLEKFILIISCTFEGRPDAAKGFWSDPDSNLFGFLQWSTKRLTTPRACASTEMVLSLSQGEDNATSAHRFLLNESTTSVGKIRKSNSLSWGQIVQDLRHFASEVREPSAAPPRFTARTGKTRTEQSSGEPETFNMLESYLRLTAQLAGHSSVARSWLLTQTSHPVLELLFLWCSSSIPSRLRACAFDAMRGLLTDKTPELSTNLWQLLDQWLFAGAPTSSSFPKITPTTTTALWTPGAMFEMICEGFEETNAFVALLDALMAPYPDHEIVNDVLPFPEYLGSAHRMPGVEPYVDFVMGRVFSFKLPQIHDVFQQRLLRQTCLGFVMTCLSTFNENLVIFANASNVAVDFAISATSLSAYARLHTLSRVMDWLFNDRALQELFATARQEVEEVAKVSSNSSLVLGLLRSIETMNIVLEMQYTYLDIVRPLTQKADNNRGAAVANTALASFEDAILDNIELVVNLGLYSTTEHLNLITVSLGLLEKLATSSKLRNAQRKILSVFDINGESERVAKSMTFQMSFDDRELAFGPGSPGYIIKERILSFLRSCLVALADRPNVAHLFLGFSCTGNSIEVSPESEFANNKALFHSILNIICEFPDETDGVLQSWLLNVKKLGLEILQCLWGNPLSTVYTMTELRACDFLFNQLAGLSIIDVNTLFDGRSILDPQFLMTSSAPCYETFLHRRSILLEYVAMEIRVVSENRAPTLKARILSALLGTTLTLNGDQVPCPSVLDLFDFADLELNEPPALPVLQYYSDLDLTVCMKSGPGSIPLYDLKSMEQLLFLRQNELKKAGKVPADKEESLHSELLYIIEYSRAHNHRVGLLHRRLFTLTAWARLLILVIEIGDLGPDLKATFILQTLQLVLPKLERYANQDSREALELARLSKTLLFSIEPISRSMGKGHAGDVALDRLFSLFRISLRGIYSPMATSELRETFYNICHRYVVGFWDNSPNSKVLKRNGSKVIKASGEALMDAVCDDAYSGNGGSRISALLFLDALISSTQEERSTYVMDSLVRLNFLGLLVDSLKFITAELTNAPGQDIPLLLSYYNAKLSLLLRVSQTRLGATCIFNAGLFQSVRESGLFSIDPDLGLDIDNPEALKKYYSLLLSVLRIITSVVMSRGPDNQQTIAEARRFLSENRQTIVTVFKRHAKIGGGGGGGGSSDGVTTQAEKPEVDLRELVKNLVLLISVTDYLNFEEETSLGPSSSSSTAPYTASVFS